MTSKNLRELRFCPGDVGYDFLTVSHGNLLFF